MAIQFQTFQGLRDVANSGPAVARAGLLWILLVAGLLYTFDSTVWSIVRIWAISETYGHGFLIVPIAAFMAWRRRDLLAAERPQPTFWGLAALAVICAVWLMGELAEINLIRHFAVVAMIQAATLMIFGWRIVRILAFPLLFLLMAVPFGDFAIVPLQNLTADYVAMLLRLTGVPVHLDDWRLTIPGGSFLVAEECSGVRYLLATLSLGLLISDVMFRKRWKVVLFLALSLIVPIVANVFRAYGIVMLAYLSDFEIAVGVDHLIYGWGFLSIVTVILILIALKMADPAPGREAAAPGDDRPDDAAPPRAQAAGNGDRRTFVKAAGCTAVALAAVIAVKSHADGALAAPDVAWSVELAAPSTDAGWRHDPEAAPAWEGAFKGSDFERTWVYESGSREVSVYTAYYAQERPGSELISWRNRLVAGDDRRLVAHGRTSEAAGPAGLPRPAFQRATGEREGRLIWYWYWVDGHFTTEPITAKWLVLRARLLGVSPSSAVIAVSSAAGEDSPAVLRDFLGSVNLADWLEDGAAVSGSDGR